MPRIWLFPKGTMQYLAAKHPEHACSRWRLYTHNHRGIGTMWPGLQGAHYRLVFALPLDSTQRLCWLLGGLIGYNSSELYMVVLLYPPHPDSPQLPTAPHPSFLFLQSPGHREHQAAFHSHQGFAGSGAVGCAGALCSQSQGLNSGSGPGLIPHSGHTERQELELPG